MTERSFHIHSKHRQHFQSVLPSLAPGQIEHLPCRLPPPFFTAVGEADCLQATPIALMALRACLSKFPLSVLLLIRGVTISFHTESRYRRLRFFFFFCCQLGYSSAHSTNAVTQATSIKFRNSFKGQRLVNLVQVCSLKSLSRTSTPLLVVF